MTIHNKLVRDNIPAILKKSGVKFRVHPVPLTDKQFLNKLYQKIREEYVEIIQSINKEQQLEESADLVEVIYAIVELLGYTAEDLELVRIKKKEERGGFSKRVFLIQTIEP